VLYLATVGSSQSTNVGVCAASGIVGLHDVSARRPCVWCPARNHKATRRNEKDDEMVLSALSSLTQLLLPFCLVHCEGCQSPSKK
jgi:hypothetical protein